MQIRKRNNQLVPFDLTKIERAIGLALGESNETIEWNAYEQLLAVIQGNIKDQMSVEDVSDIVERKLMEFGLYFTAKRYILFRSERAFERGVKSKRRKGLLTDEFLSKYKHMTPPMTQMGELVYYRTYSRYLPEYGRREFWWETVARAVEYNCSLIPTSRQEAEQLFDNVFHLRQFLSGRTFWVGGTDVANKFPMANYNCSGQIVDDFEAFRDLFYLLLIGSGAGVRITKSDTAKLPKVRTDLEVINKAFVAVPKSERIESTALIFDKHNSAKIIVGDSKEGWVQALDFYFKLHYSNEYKNVKTLTMIYDNVRPKGEALKTFGGTASGHDALLEMFIKIDKVIKKYPDKRVQLKPIDCLDIANIIGDGVVVGGVRRTAEIVLFDSDDEEVLKAKSALYQQTDDGWKINHDIIHRQMSNNSIFYKQKPTRERLHWQIEQMRYSGEPGFLNSEGASKRRNNFQITNPCGEILLNNKGLCNLTTLNVFAFVKDGKLDENGLYEAQMLSANSSYRMTNVELELPKWDAVQREERLTGCSLTGWQDMVNACWLSKEDEIRILKKLREVAHSATEHLANKIGANKPLLVTTVKPEGTLSQLPTVSSGVHYSHSPYYIRRIRINANDPLVKVCEEIGYTIKPEVGQDWETCRTKVIEFPVKAPSGKTKYDVGAIEQLENYKLFMEHYCDHNVSITVHVLDHEWDEVEQWVWDNWDDVVAVSFLPLDDSFYELLPYESISEDEYKVLNEKIKGKRITPDRISMYETIEGSEIDDSGCDAGVCPIR